MSAYDGFLLAWENLGSDTQIVEKWRAAVRDVPNLSEVEDQSSPHWQRYMLRSSVPLNDEYVDDRSNFHYEILIRINRATGNIILASINKRISEYALNSRLNIRLTPHLTKIAIRIREFVHYIIENSESDYTLTAVYADIVGSGAHLKTASLFGDDIAQADLFRKNLELFSPFLIGLRLRTGISEILRIGSDGYLHFYGRELDSFREVERCLGYIKRLGFYVG